MPRRAQFSVACFNGESPVSKASINVAIVGATGAVGQELLQLLHQRNFPMSSLRLLASARSAGKVVECAGKKYTVEEAKPGAFAGVQVAFFAAGGSVTRALAPDAVKAGCLVIDKSSHYRMDPDVPLVIPEINPQELRQHKGIIANPNCSTAVTLMALWPLHKAFGLKRYFCATYQSVSGTGAEAIRELDDQVHAYAKGAPLTKKVYPYQIAFNVIPQVDSFGANGYTGEETKMMLESRKIMGLPDLKVSSTTVRVPVVRAHSVAVNAEFERPVSVEAARAAVAAFEGAELIDDPANKVYPTPLDFSKKVKCGVGRIRIDTAFDNGLALWVSGDNLWKGAALNAIQNAELMVREGMLKA
ncbi:MAG: aspartate-semialdehyde dehydrogenase [Verrucomicrobia bacterium]|nr:aspartate-semialdehyde dehydrogenase [Verrucomicrobiota bacterium]